MASPPSTPPAKVPENPDEWRFVYSGALCEFPEDYCPGGFHPVNLGDRFHNGRYRVIRKLGEGAYSIVWLAVDTKTPRYVALKIMVAKASTTITELSILDHLSQRAPSDPNSQHVTTLLDTFTHTGPNGTHRCMVFEPMGITAASLVEELPENKPKTFGVRQRYPYWMAKKILRHALLSLAFLHSNGVVHGDVQPGNMLFAIDDLSSVAEDELKQDEASTSVQLRRVDGKEDRWAPKTLYIPQPLHDRVQLVPEHLHVKLSDLGACEPLFSSPLPAPSRTPTTPILTASSLLHRAPTLLHHHAHRPARPRAHPPLLPPAHQHHRPLCPRKPAPRPRHRHVGLRLPHLRVHHRHAPLRRRAALARPIRARRRRRRPPDPNQRHCPSAATVPRGCVAAEGQVVRAAWREAESAWGWRGGPCGVCAGGDAGGEVRDGQAGGWCGGGRGAGGVWVGEVVFGV
ncbi:SRSF protein kinase 2 [Diplodia seriata]|uniref:non-specific serine/threonine protein kinase n=1 Tax=Diplodia seriata TaxID=420778 RepID=A0A1S8BCA2_9PEZI|nr:SRSF protein kinase 2 [Diplodia seriata]